MLKLILDDIVVPFRVWVSKDPKNESRSMGFCWDIPVSVRTDTMEEAIECLKEGIREYVRKRDSDENAVSV
jgi:hypothetical protein